MRPGRITLAVSLAAVFLVSGSFAANAFAQSRLQPTKSETVVPPPKQFKSAEGHYNFLLQRAKGGTKLTAWARGTLNMLSALNRGR